MFLWITCRYENYSAESEYSEGSGSRHLEITLPFIQLSRGNKLGLYHAIAFLDNHHVSECLVANLHTYRRRQHYELLENSGINGSDCVSDEFDCHRSHVSLYRISGQISQIYLTTFQLCTEKFLGAVAKNLIVKIVFNNIFRVEITWSFL